MKYTDALEELKSFYVFGAVAFYDGFNPNPWQIACDEMNEALKTGDYALVETASQIWVDTLRDLIVQFKKIRTIPKPGLQKGDQLWASDEAIVRKKATLEKRCIKCERTAGFQRFPAHQKFLKLTIQPVENSKTEVYLICEECK